MSRQKGGDSKKKLEPVDKTNKVAELKGCTYFEPVGTGVVAGPAGKGHRHSGHQEN
ncbi:hypothetical protein FOMA001_g18033 [Fusarium oxysporum f. sp. matthiolae]|nr:hypothetical protein FOMA001_g18033 [Fusarium oxysporum f. sp. matthiolae]